MPAIEITLRTPVRDSTGTEPRVSHAILLTSAQLARGLARIVFVLAVARQLGPKLFGVYALVLALVEIVAVASGTGYADYLTREAAKDARLGWGLGSQLIWLRLTSTVPLAMLAVAALWLLHYPRTVLVAEAWLSLSLAPRAVSEAVQGVLRGLGRYLPYLFAELTLDLGLVAGAAWLILHQGGFYTAIATELIAATAAGWMGFIFLLSFRPRQLRRLPLRQLLQKSFVFNIYAFVGNLYDRLDVLLLSNLAGDYATGVYSAAYRPLGTVQLLPYGVLYSLLPTLSRNVNGAEERQRLERVMGFLLSASFALVLFTMVFAGPTVRWVLGESYAESALALKILIWAVILRYANYTLSVHMLAAGLERVFMQTSLVCLGVNLAGNLVFIPLYSWKAAATLTILTEAILLAQNYYWLRRTMGSIPKPFAGVRVSVVFVTLLAAWFIGMKLVPPLLLGALCVVAFLTYLYRSGLLADFVAAWRTSRGLA